MTVRRIMGLETEYGVLQPGHPLANPMLLSSHVVAVHAPAHEGGARPGVRSRARWDYCDEDPLQDARGFHVLRAAAHPSLLTDDPSRPAPSGEAAGSATRKVPREAVEEYEDPGASNVVLTSGARLYVDHAHPEYSSPEVTNPLDAVRWDRAGQLVMLASVRALTGSPALPDVLLYKNNVDGKGATYGAHENYLVHRAVPFADLAARLMPFLVTRQVFTGAGRVGVGQRGEQPGFQLSQRADYVEAEIGLETTLRRPIVNTRDEPHADPARWRRLHVIVGDATMLETATYLRAGTTSLVLWLIERGLSGSRRARDALATVDALRLAHPVDAMHQVSHDLTLRRRLELADGRHLTALEIQRAYLDAVREALVGQPDDDHLPDDHLPDESTPDDHAPDEPTRAGDRGPGGGGAPCDAPDAQTRDVLARWESLLTRLAEDPARCAREVEWCAKLRLLDAMRRRENLGWDHPKLAAVDLQWSDVRPERGLYYRLEAAGAVERLLPDDAIAAAVRCPPGDTRAYFRGEAVRRFPGEVAAASWDAVVFDVPGTPFLQRVPMPDPSRRTRAELGALLAVSPDAATLLRALPREHKAGE